MGVRIHAYAADLARLDTFLESSLAELLCRYVRDGIESDEDLMVTVDRRDGNPPDLFVATPGGSIGAATTTANGRRRVYSTIVASADLGRFPLLQQSARDYLSSESVYPAYWLLQGFSRCAGLPFIRRLIEGHRRWWIGSVLQCAERLDASILNESIQLFRRMLRGYDCGYSIPVGDIGVVTVGLPYAAHDDPDLRFGRWNGEDCQFMAKVLSGLLASKPRFIVPPGPIGIGPDASEWHQWVYENVESLLQVAELQYEKLNVLSFIG